jgi:phage terminase large subunit-like protein
MAGRGFGKTRVGAERPGRRKPWPTRLEFPNIIGATADDARDIMIEGESGILASARRGNGPTTSRRNGSCVAERREVADLHRRRAGTAPRQAAHVAVGDELAAWRYPEAWDQAMLGLRLGDEPAGGRHDDAEADRR